MLFICDLAATFLLVAWCLSRSASSALTTDLLTVEALAVGLPRLDAIDALASIVGFALTGLVMDTLGGPALFPGATLLAFGAPAVLAGMAWVGQDVGRAHGEAAQVEPQSTVALVPPAQAR